MKNAIRAASAALAALVAYSAQAGTYYAAPGAAEGAQFTRVIPGALMLPNPDYDLAPEWGSPGPAGSYRGAAYANGHYVVSGNYGTLLYSTDLQNWKQASGLPDLYNASIKNIKHSNGTWIAHAVGARVPGEPKAHSMVLRSNQTPPDNWEIRATYTTTTPGRALPDGQGGWLTLPGVFGGLHIYSVDDGLTWTVGSTTHPGLRGYAFFNGAWYAGDVNGNILRSTDPIGAQMSFTAVHSLPTGTLCWGLSVIDNQLWCSGPEALIASSGDGSAWQLRHHDPDSVARLSHMRRVQNLLVSISPDKFVAVSGDDGVTWQIGQLGDGQYGYHAVISDGYTGLIVGDNGEAYKVSSGDSQPVFDQTAVESLNKIFGAITAAALANADPADAAEPLLALSPVAQSIVQSADRDGDGDLDEADITAILGGNYDFDYLRQNFGDGSSTAPRDQLIHLFANGLIDVLNEIAAGDASSAAIAASQSYIEVLELVIGSNGGRYEILRAPADVVIDTAGQ